MSHLDIKTGGVAMSEERQTPTPKIRKRGLLRRFKSDNKGVAALEFAIIAPILVLLFLGTLEISLAVAVDRKVARISSTVADLITRQSGQFDKAFLDTIYEVSDRIMYPYSDQVEIVIVGVDIDASGTATVAWSDEYGGASGPATGSAYTVPSSIRTPDSFLIAASVKTDHAPAFKFVNYKNGGLTFDGASIELSEEMFLRPRQSNNQICSDC